MKRSISFLIFLLFFVVQVFGNENNLKSDEYTIFHLKNLYTHANRLVRENNFESAQFFYDNAFIILDSLKNSHNSDIYLDSCEFDLNQYSENFGNILNLLDYKLKINNYFLFSKKDIEIETKHLSRADTFLLTDNKKVRRQEKFYKTRARRTFQKRLNNSILHINAIKKIFKAYGLSEDLAYLPMIESAFNPLAHSYAQASGLWQFIKSTGKSFGLKTNWWVDERKNIYKSTIAAAKYLKILYSRFGDWNLALAAYNCGEWGVKRRIKRQKTKNFWALWRLPKQTKKYIPKFIATVKMAKNPEKYGFKIPDNVITNLDTIQLDSCINLNLVAKLSNITYEVIKFLNPELKQWCLPPYSRGYPLIIPAEVKMNLRKKINIASEEEKYSVCNYKIKKNDNIIKLSKRYKIDKAGIYDLNNLTAKSKLKIGDEIKIIVPPVKEKWFTNFNNKYLTFYDGEKYFLDGRKNVRYRVRKGDSIWNISRKFKVGMKKIKGWNKIGRKNYIYPGQLLVIYF